MSVSALARALTLVRLYIFSILGVTVNEDWDVFNVHNRRVSQVQVSSVLLARSELFFMIRSESYVKASKPQ